MNNILVVNKETGLTSRDVVNKLCKIFNTKKIGHTGTLDPMAEGVLVCLIGKYTKLERVFSSEEKEYIATIKLGIKTDTLDITGNIIDENYAFSLDKNMVNDVLLSFVGKYIEEVPLYSAIHVNGKRLYEYAREKKDVILPKKTVYIKEMELLEFNEDSIRFRCLVSKGTYIRSLIRDICEKLHVLGTMSELIRISQGKFNINNSYKLKDIENGDFRFVDLKSSLNIKEIYLNNELNDLYKKVVNGNKIELNLDGYVLFKKNRDIALYYFNDNVGRLIILF